MKVVILAGGYGTRISEESHLFPKPMIEIGNQPILWHIMKYISHYHFNEFIICCGYKQSVIKDYFNRYYLHMSDVTFDFASDNKMIIKNKYVEPWVVTVVDTGLDTMTGGRIKRIQDYIKDESFILTYGDGLSNVNISDVVEFHKQHNKIATITAIQPEGRFGHLDIDERNNIGRFKEKSLDDEGWINGGYMVLDSSIMNYISGDDCSFEYDTLEKLADIGEVNAYKHRGFWMCMDTLRDKQKLEKIWESENVPWKVW